MTKTVLGASAPSVSPLSRLKTSPVPVDRAAARVAFWKGEHFTPEFPSHHFVRSWETPPKVCNKPSDALDYTGIRHGRMTAMYWLAPKERWVAQCDCGRYEVRKPGRWAEHPSPEDDPDRCEYCRRWDVVKRLGNAHSRTPVRLMKWVDTMRRLGLTDDEITKIRIRDDIDTKEKTAEEIREQLSMKEMLP